MSADKQAIRSAFSRAARDYDSVAALQRRVALHLLQQTPVCSQILDAGCGTGFGADQLRARFPQACVLMLDAAHGMCARNPERMPICGDIEALPLRARSLDLYWSSLAWQWTDPFKAAAEAARVLRPGGTLRIATLGPGTLGELRQAFAAVDTHPHVRDFHPLITHRAALEAAGLVRIEIRQSLEQVFAADLRSLLSDIRRLGAHELGDARQRGLFGRRAWLRLQGAYEAFRCAEGLPASYDVFYLSASKA